MNEIVEIIEKVSRIASEELPTGFRLVKVDLTLSDLDGTRKPNFTITIEVTREDDKPDPGGWAYQITQRIRQLWSPDHVYVSLRVHEV